MSNPVAIASPTGDPIFGV